MTITILRQGRTLIVPLGDDLTDSAWGRLAHDLLTAVVARKTDGVVVDVSRVDTIDSYAGRTLGGLAAMLRLRGAATVVVGIQPDVAMAMVQLGLRLEGADTALDLDDALVLLRDRRSRA